MNTGYTFFRAYYTVLDRFAKAHPYQLTNPGNIDFFVRYDNRYYPVQYVTIRDKWGDGRWLVADLHINRSVFCLNPLYIHSPFTGQSLEANNEQFKECEGHYCPEFPQIHVYKDGHRVTGNLAFDIEQVYDSDGKVVFYYREEITEIFENI